MTHKQQILKGLNQTLWMCWAIWYLNLAALLMRAFSGSWWPAFWSLGVLLVLGLGIRMLRKTRLQIQNDPYL